MPQGNKLVNKAKEQGKTIEKLIVETIEHTGGRAEAAQALHVTPATIDYHLRKYGLQIVTRAKVVSQDQTA